VARQGRGDGAPSVAISPSLTPRWQSGRHPGPGRGCPPVVEATDVGDPIAPHGQDLPALDRSSSLASGHGPRSRGERGSGGSHRAGRLAPADRECRSRRAFRRRRTGRALRLTARPAPRGAGPARARVRRRRATHPAVKSTRRGIRWTNTRSRTCRCTRPSSSESADSRR
jgi:hypothetical protein